MKKVTLAERLKISKKDERALFLAIYFDRELTPQAIEKLFYVTEHHVEKIIGAKFRNEINCGIWELYRKKVTKDQIATYIACLSRKEGEERYFPVRHLSARISAGPSYPLYVPRNIEVKDLYFSYTPPKKMQVKHCSIHINIEYRVPFDFTAAQLLALMHGWARLLQNENVHIKYGYIEPMQLFVLDRPIGRVPAPIPDNKLMGVRWGNLLTKQHLGAEPKKLIAAINQAIAPNKVIEVMSGIYWFTLPFDLNRYDQITHDEYLALMHKTLDVFRPFNVLWRKGTRKGYD